MTKESVDLVISTRSQWSNKHFLRNFSVEVLQEALDYLEEQDNYKTQSQRRAIWYEIQYRKSVGDDPCEHKGPFYHAPRKGDQFIQDWNEVCRIIYQRIQFLPPIPLVKG